MITGGITIKILDQRQGKVRLGIVAPANVRVLREELVAVCSDAPKEANTGS